MGRQTLSWREAPVRVAATAPESAGAGKAHSRTQVLVEADRDRVEELLPLLRETFEGRADMELRLDLPENWTLYWKQGSGTESRLLLAHPRASEWVVTVALTAGHAADFVRALENLRVPGATASVGGTGRLHAVSNLELLVRLV